MRKKRKLAILLATVMFITVFSGGMASAKSSSPNLTGAVSDPASITNLNLDVPDQEFKTEVRWWLAQGAHTDETIKESVKEIYDAGFTGIEFAMLNDTNVPAAIYGYGSEEWLHDAKLLLEETTKYGMSLSFTSGTHWASANIPGLDPNSRAAGQEFRTSEQRVAAGQTRTGALTMPPKRGAMVTEQKPIIVGAYKLEGAYNASAAHYNPMKLVQGSFIDLTDKVETVVNPDNGAVTYNLDWTAPGAAGDPEYILFTFCQQGIARSNNPAIETCYDINYFDKAGVEALKEYWNGYYFNDPELVSLIKENGNVQMFLDSLEIGTSGGDFTFWSDEMADIFLARKGYDIRPYLPLFVGSSGVWTEGIKNFCGKYDLGGIDGAEFRRKIRNDLYDIHTALLMENMMDPLREWLGENYGMKLRAQISYGQYMEISLPAMSVDYVENESRNMRDQPDAFRSHAGAAHLLGKVYSSETGADNGMNYFHSMQDYLQKCYAFFSGGGNRVIWHGYASTVGLTKNSAPWPGYEAGMGTIAGRWGSREPAYKDYPEYNNHLGRLQTVLRAGKSRVDLGILQLDYGYWAPRRSIDPASALALQNHHGLTWKDTILQDNGYTYDYFAPQYLDQSGLVIYDPESGLIAPDGPGYQALMVFQEWMPLSSAESLLNLAKQGMKLVIVEGALTKTAFYGDYLTDGTARLGEIRSELLALPNVASVKNQADALGALKGMDVVPRAGFGTPNQQLLSVMREDDDATYLYLWNYTNLPGSNQPGTTCDTEIEVDGEYVPYALNTWSGEISAVPVYHIEDGKTRFPVSIAASDVALYIFKEAASDTRHLVSGDGGEIISQNGKYYIRATSGGDYSLTRNDGALYQASVPSVPAARNLTGWDLTVEDWNKPDTTNDENWITRTETRNGHTTTEGYWVTQKNIINLKLQELATWNNIPEIGRDVSGIGYYKTTFEWDAAAANGAKLDLGPIVQTVTVKVNGKKTADININKAIVDISSLLVDGTNTLEITVATGLTNRQLANGYLREGMETGSSARPDQAGNYTYQFPDHIRRYFNNGLPQAMLIPYVETEAKMYSAVIVDKDTRQPLDPQQAYMDAAFHVLVKTPADVINIKFVNENGSAIGRSIVDKKKTGENELTWLVSMSVGTVGEGRTLRLYAQGDIGDYSDTMRDLVFNVVKPEPASVPESQVISTEWIKKGGETSVRINEEFTVKVVTTADVSKVSIRNESGGSIGQISKTVTTNGKGNKEWLITIKMGSASANPRTITACGYSPKDGDLPGRSFQIVVTK